MPQKVEFHLPDLGHVSIPEPGVRVGELDLPNDLHIDAFPEKIYSEKAEEIPGRQKQCHPC